MFTVDVKQPCNNNNKNARLRPDFTSKLVHVLAFGTPKFYIAPYDKIKHEFVNLSSNCDVKSGLSVISLFSSTNTSNIYFFAFVFVLLQFCNNASYLTLSRS